MIWDDSSFVWELISVLCVLQNIHHDGEISDPIKADDGLCIKTQNTSWLSPGVVESNHPTGQNSGQQTLFSWWVEHQKSLERASGSSQPSPPYGCEMCSALFYTFEDVTELSDDPGLQSGEHLNTRINVTLFILERLAGFALLKKLTLACKYRKNALQESRQELRDQVKVQQTPPWSQWHLTPMMGGDAAETLARQTDQSHFKWDAEDTWEQSIFKLD